MTEILILIACAAFVVFLIGGDIGKYAALAGWVLVVINFLLEVPQYLNEDNILYPFLAAASVPFLAITIQQIYRGNQTVFRLSRAAAVAILIYIPFTSVPLLRNTLISGIVQEVFWVLQILGKDAQLTAWNVITRNGFSTEIILACTGITAIAILLGVTAAGRDISPKHIAYAILLVVPPIYLLNILRVAGVMIAWSEQWFAFLPDISGTLEFGPGYSSFFWAHTVFAEILALGVLILITLGLFRVVPGLSVFARDLAGLYLSESRAILRTLGWRR